MSKIWHTYKLGEQPVKIPGQMYQDTPLQKTWEKLQTGLQKGLKQWLYRDLLSNQGQMVCKQLFMKFPIYQEDMKPSNTLETFKSPNPLTSSSLEGKLSSKYYMCKMFLNLSRNSAKLYYLTSLLFHYDSQLVSHWNSPVVLSWSKLSWLKYKVSY